MTFFLLCRGRSAQKLCRWCLASHTFLCDHPKAGGGTCDAPMCSLHAKEVGPDRHLCPDHAQAAPAQLSLEAQP